MFKTVGHDRQKEFLEKALQDGKSAQSYLFAGPSEIGKRTLALEFAKKLLKIEGEFHPDFITADADGMQVSAMRELLSLLARSPFSAALKVAVIDNFEKASPEVSNALLKTLEEPNSSTLIILIASNYKKVLPTIVSRSQVLNFGRLPEKSAEDFGGKMGISKRYQTDSEFAKFFDSSAEEYDKLKDLPAAERLLQIKGLSEFEDVDLRKKMEVWMESEYAQPSAGISRAKNLASLAIASSSLETNMNRKLILQKVLLGLEK